MTLSDAFAAHADEYCGFVDQSGQMSPREFTLGVHSRIAALYAAGLALPSPVEHELGEADDSDDDEAFTEPTSIPPDADRLSYDEWQAIYERIGMRLAAADMYMEMFDPFGWNEQPVVGSLADDLADIYEEIRAGLLKWRRGEFDDAVWTWRFGMESHWAEHATGAMRALHALIFRYDFEPPPPSDERPNER